MTRRHLIAIAAATAACASDDHLATKEQPLIHRLELTTRHADVPLLRGFTALTDELRGSCVKQVKNDPCVDQPPKSTSANVSETFKLHMISSRQELEDKLGISASLSAQYNVVNVNASVNLQKEARFTSNTITLLMQGELTYWSTVDQTHHRVELTDEARKLLKEDTKPDLPQQFFIRCGDSWTTAYQRGAQFYVLVTITTSSQETRDDLEASLGVKAGTPLVGVEIGANVKMSQAVKRANASTKLEVVARGFMWNGQEAETAIKNLLGPELKDDTLGNFVKIRTAMQHSVNDDRCLDAGFFGGAKLGPDGRYICVNDPPIPGRGSYLMRVNLSDYATVGNLPEFTENWDPLSTYERRADQAMRYVSQLAVLERRMVGTYYDELAPYQGAAEAARSMHGLAPPQVVPYNTPFFKLRDPAAGPRSRFVEQDVNVDYWADKFKPPGGDSVNRVHTAADRCWVGINTADFKDCTCPGAPGEAPNRCLSRLDAYRMSWIDLFDYRETGRVLPHRAMNPVRGAANHAGAAALCACDANPRVLLTLDEIRRAALMISNVEFGQGDARTAWLQQPPPGSPYRCKQGELAVYQNHRQSVPNGQDRMWCVGPQYQSGVLCVPPGGLFAQNRYGDPLQGLPRPPPQVVWSDPHPRGPRVAPEAVVTLVFSAPLDPTTVTPANIKLRAGATDVEAELAYRQDVAGGGTVTITPTEPLAGGTYTIAVGTGVKGTDGDAMIAAFSSTFTVSNSIKTATPAANATGVALDRKVTVEFRAPVDGATVTDDTVQLWRGNKQVTALIGYDAATRTATLTPERPLSTDTKYVVVVDGVLGAAPARIPVLRAVWEFKTGTVLEQTTPADGAVDVSPRTGIWVTYSDLSTGVPAGAFTLKKGNALVAATTQVGPFVRSISLSPDADLEPNTTYTATVTTAVKDRHGTPMLTGKTWTFTTGALENP